MKKRTKKNFFVRNKKLLYILFGVIVICVSFVLFAAQSYFAKARNTVQISMQQMINPFQAEVSSAAIPDAKIAYYTRGTGSPIILLPGFGMTMHDWDPLFLEQLSLHHQLIILDFRGVGNSTGSTGSLSQKQLTEDVIAFMNTMKLKKATILGWSMGSFIAQDVAEQYPKRVNKLILVGTGPGGDEQIGASESISTKIQDNLDGSWEAVYVPFLFSTDQAKKAYLVRLKNAEQTKEIPNVASESTETKLAFERAFAFADEESARNASLSAIKAPTLIISGAKDKLVPVSNAKKTAARIPGSKLAIIPAAGHAVLFEKPYEVTTLINTFIEKK